LKRLQIGRTPDFLLFIGHDIPVMTHCSPGGIWQYGLSEVKRRAYTNPESYLPVFEAYPTLKLCLAHFGGAEEWARRLNRELKKDKYPEQPWVRTIYEMISGGQDQCPTACLIIISKLFEPVCRLESILEVYLRMFAMRAALCNLYTDIAYTVFTPRVQGLYVDLVDYLKVLLSQPRVRTRVLFGSDYYMVAQEKMSEKEASILLRSRLGEDLYRQIAYTNPMEYLGKPPEAKATQRKKTTRK
jgi:predicted TIM-barrel fold metal-dependent hydrolase